jgi:DNA polymerase I-like protein with 3'-5' exonuclease and polymerase domains
MKAVKNRGEKEYQRAIAMLNGQGAEWAFDVETTGLNTRKDKIIGFGISNGLKGFYFCHQYFEDGKLVEALSVDDCRFILNLIASKKLLMWNGAFDCAVTYNYFGVDLTPSLWMDGMLGKHQVQEEPPFALKKIGVQVYGKQEEREQLDLFKSIKDNGGDPKEYYKADLDIMAKYCIQDCHLTFRLCFHFLDKINEEGLNSFFFNEETMPLYKNVTIPMEMKGIPVDVPLLERLQFDIQKDIEDLEQEIQNLISPLLEEVFVPWFLGNACPPKRSGKFAQALCKLAALPLPQTRSGAFSLSEKALESLENSIYKSFLQGEEWLPEDEILKVQKSMTEVKFNLASKRHLRILYFNTLQESPLSYTPTGQAQVNDEFLKSMGEEHVWTDLLRNLNKLQKIKSTYIDRLLTLQEDGIFYPSFSQHKTISGRYGSDIQQLPRPKGDDELHPMVLKYNNFIRQCFIAGDNHVFIDSDYESLEPHVFAHVSGDKRLKNIFRSGCDFYSTIAIATEKLDGTSAFKKDNNYLGRTNKLTRQRAKAYALGIPYGMNAYALSKSLNCEIHEAKGYIDAYLEAYPDLATWIRDTVYHVIENGQIESEAGRIRHMPKVPEWHKKGIGTNRSFLKKYNYKSEVWREMSDKSNKMKNYLNNSRNFQIQSLAASITNRACIAIAKELKEQGVDGHVCAQIHDQIVVRVPKAMADKWRKRVQYLMENTYKLSIPLKAPADIGVNFADAH